MGPPPESARSWAAIRTPFRRRSSKKRALVTGGAGCLGSHPSDRVLAEGYSVVEGPVDAVLHFASPAAPRDNHVLDGTIETRHASPRTASNRFVNCPRWPAFERRRWPCWD